MAEARAARAAPAPITDWTLRPFEALPVAPVWLGLGIGLAYMALWAGFYAVVDPGADLWAGPNWWSELLNGALFGYMPAANAQLRRGALRDLCDLRPTLRCSDAEFERLVAEATCVSPGRLRGFGLVGALAGVAIVFFDPGIWGGGPRPGVWEPVFLFVLVRNALILALVARLAVSDLDTTRAFARLGERYAEVDLLDLRPLRPFARKGQRSAIAWVLGTSIVALFWLTASPALSNMAAPIVVIAMVTTVLVLPLRGVHSRIREVKDAELGRVRQEIRREREASLSARGGGAARGGRLADLIAYLHLVDGVREWPIDAPTLLRVALFVALGVGSWLGGALVERLLDGALG